MPDQMKRLDRVARKRGISKQQFIEAAVIKELNEHEESSLRVKAEREEAIGRKGDTTPSTLGIANRLKQQDQQAAVSESPTPSPVVVNVGQQTGSGGGDIIEKLATFVLAGSDFERSTRLRTAVDILKDTTSSEEERRVLAARLDEVIAVKTKTTTPTNDGNTVVRTARVAFDKLTALLNK